MADQTAVQSPKKLSSALQWAFVMSWGPNCIATLLTFVLAAYLGPGDYGVVAMAALYISFVQMFLESGLGTALVQRENLQPEHLDAVFWITLTFSVSIMLITWTLSPWWAAANHAVELSVVLNVLSITLPIEGLTVVQESLMERNLDFRSLAIRSNISTLVGGVFGLTLAIRHFGVWALVGEDLLSALVRLTLLWRLGKWRPALRFSYRHVRELFGYSFKVLAAQIGTFVQRRSDALLIGLFFGPAAVGIYRLADRLVSTVIELATRPFLMVAIPHFSRLQSDFVGLRKAIMQCIRGSAMMTLPMLAIIAGLAYLICEGLSVRGSNWNAAIVVIQILALAGAARAVTLLVTSLMQAINRATLAAVLTWALALANTVAFCVAGWLLHDSVDVKQQAVGVAIARVGVFVVFYTPISFFIMCKVCDIRWRDLGRTLAPTLLTSALVCVIGLVIEKSLRMLPFTGSWAKLGEMAFAGMVTTAIAGVLAYMIDPEARKFIDKRLKKLRPVPAVVSSDELKEVAAEEAVVAAGSGTEQSDLQGDLATARATA